MTAAFTVLVSPACPACAGARAITEYVAEHVGAAVHVVDVTTVTGPLPDGYVGTPMVYVADTVVSYGTPTAGELVTAYRREAHR